LATYLLLSFSPNGGIIGGAIAGAVAIIALALFLCLFLRRRRNKRREAAEGQGLKPEMTHTNSNTPGYNVPYGTQYPSTTTPQIQEHNARDNAGVIQPYMTSAAGAPRQSSDTYSRPMAQHSGITVHAPQARLLSDQTAQSIAYYSTQSSDQQSPASNRLSHSTDATAPLVPLGTRDSTESTSANPPWRTDRKERIASPSLPPGAMAPSRIGGGQYGSMPLWEPPSSPSSGMHAWKNPTSPPPPSLTGTALPPYELGSQYQGSIRE
jgi:hypothetical protein